MKARAHLNTSMEVFTHNKRRWKCLLHRKSIWKRSFHYKVCLFIETSLHTDVLRYTMFLILVSGVMFFALLLVL